MYVDERERGGKGGGFTKRTQCHLVAIDDTLNDRKLHLRQMCLLNSSSVKMLVFNYASKEVFRKF